MNFSPIKNRVQALLVDPKREFLVIKTESQTSTSILNNFVYPLMLVFIITTFIGSVVFGNDTLLDGIINFVFSILVTIPAVFLSIYIGIWSMKKVFPKVNLNYQHFKLNLPELKIETLGLKTFTLIAYSLTPVYISMIVSGVFPGLSKLINLFGLYGFIVYWLGAEVIIDEMIPKNRNLFIILSLSIFVVLFLLMRLGMKSLFELFL
ncbi:MAG: hypothetical protein WCX31_16130 [Salinivirgaceae bacterium]|jgi:hypothetical protein